MTSGKNSARGSERVTAEQISAFRLARHHLSQPGERDLVRVCAAICGAQSQVDSAGRLALWAGMEKLEPGQVEDALWQQRTLVVAPRFYKRVYRNQGWISPVVLVNGRVAGTWAHTRTGRKLSVQVEPFEKLKPAVRQKIQYEALRLGTFLGIPADVIFKN
jgi:hypothetical protein